MQIVVESAGCVVAQDGNRMILLRRSLQGYTVALFVLGLVTFITAANAVLQLALAGSGEGSVAAAAILVAATGVVGTPLLFVFRDYRRRRALPPESLPRLAVVDPERGLLLPPDETPVSPLFAVRFRQRMQIGSSGKALELVWLGGTLRIARGSVFAGGVAPVEACLESIGIHRA